MNLNNIENAESLADKSWRNINAMDDICEEVLITLDKLTVSALRGNASAGGGIGLIMENRMPISSKRALELSLKVS